MADSDSPKQALTRASGPRARRRWSPAPGQSLRNRRFDHRAPTIVCPLPWSEQAKQAAKSSPERATQRSPARERGGPRPPDSNSLAPQGRHRHHQRTRTCGPDALVRARPTHVRWQTDSPIGAAICECIVDSDSPKQALTGASGPHKQGQTALTTPFGPSKPGPRPGPSNDLRHPHAAIGAAIYECMADSDSPKQALTRASGPRARRRWSPAPGGT